MNHEELLFSIRLLLRAPDCKVFGYIVRTTPPADVAEALDSHPAEALAPLLMTLDPSARAALVMHLSEERRSELLRGSSGCNEAGVEVMCPATDTALDNSELAVTGASGA